MGGLGYSQWFLDNQNLVFAFVLYVLLNVAKRLPPPKHPAAYWAWHFAECLMFLGWDKWGGSLKLPGTVFPGPYGSSE